MPWGVLLLAGGCIALANGFTATGLDDWIAGQLGFLGGMHHVVIILIIEALELRTKGGLLLQLLATADLRQLWDSENTG